MWGVGIDRALVGADEVVAYKYEPRGFVNEYTVWWARGPQQAGRVEGFLVALAGRDPGRAAKWRLLTADEQAAALVLSGVNVDEAVADSTARLRVELGGRRMGGDIVQACRDVLDAYQEFLDGEDLDVLRNALTALAKCLPPEQS